MTQADSLITDEMRAAIGVEGEPTTYELDRTAVRMFARSVGHTDPVFYDVEAARAARYRDLPAPPGYLGTPIYNPGRSQATWRELQPARPLTRRLNGGTEIEYLAEICAGDVLTATTHLASAEERSGRLGPMLITVSKSVFRDASGKTVAIMTGTGIRY